MPIVHQDHGFDFTILAEDQAPPKAHVTGGGNKYLLVWIGKPDVMLPHIKKYENVGQEEVNWVFETVNLHQIKFFTVWERIHGGEQPPRQRDHEEPDDRPCPGADH